MLFASHICSFHFIAHRASFPEVLHVPPAPPASLTLLGGAEPQLCWPAPVQDGGAEVTGYELGLEASGTLTLLPGWPPMRLPQAQGTVRVRALNRLGCGPWGQALRLREPVAEPQAPLVVSSGATEALLRWLPVDGEGYALRALAENEEEVVQPPGRASRALISEDPREA